MAIVNVSLDTTTRQVVLTINGVMVQSTEINISKYRKYDQPDEFEVVFGYTIESVGENGIKERRQFYLPSQEELATEAYDGLNEEGFASKILHDDEKAKADVIDFLKQNRANG